ncbi:hypothetical protein F5Y18DRAFT_441931 [Xylariaceae sp. FL1019]|nr:hypothetical protein F5Y18DRAFT_441931 [Xylariaceae sp. FL1019]
MVQMRRPEDLFSLTSDNPKRNEYIIQKAKDMVKDRVHDSLLCEDCRQNWLNIGFQTPSCDDLTSFIAAVREHKESLKTSDKIVCIGSGSTVGVWDTSSSGCEKAEQYRVCSQYGTALSIAELIREVNGKDAKIIASDPAMTITEIECFPKVDIQVVNPYKHEAYGMIDSNTFVLSICAEREMKVEEMIISTSRPAAMLWDPYLERTRAVAWCFYLGYSRVQCEAFKKRHIVIEDQKTLAPLGPGTELFIKWPPTPLPTMTKMAQKKTRAENLTQTSRKSTAKKRKRDSPEESERPAKKREVKKGAKKEVKK